MYTQTFKKSTIKSAFKKIGLIFYYSKIILQQIRALLSSTRVITLFLPNTTNKMSSVCTTTPHCLLEIKNQAITLINSMKKNQRLVYLKFQLILDWFIYGSIINSF